MLLLLLLSLCVRRGWSINITVESSRGRFCDCWNASDDNEDGEEDDKDEQEDEEEKEKEEEEEDDEDEEDEKDEKLLLDGSSKIEDKDNEEDE